MCVTFITKNNVNIDLIKQICFHLNTLLDIVFLSALIRFIVISKHEIDTFK